LRRCEGLRHEDEKPNAFGWRPHSARLFLGGVVLAFALSVGSAQGGASSGLDGKLIVGYQGWFGCPKDFEDNNAWQHWFVKGVRPEHLTVDLLPSVPCVKNRCQVFTFNLKMLSCLK
jgi:hypothetical protein